MRPDNDQLAKIILGDLFVKFLQMGVSSLLLQNNNKICVVIALNGVQNSGNCAVCIIYTAVFEFLAF